MKKNLLALLYALLLATGAQAQIVITEIMYNPPEPGTDTLEYIELFNPTANAVDISGWNFTKGVTFTFPGGTTMAPGAYVIVCENAAYFQARFGFTPFQWDGALTNGGEDIELSNGGTVIDNVSYSSAAPWPTGAAGTGSSIVLCDVNADNNNGANWQASTTPTGVTSGGLPVFGNPGGPSNCVTAGYPLRTIAQMTTENASGVADSINITCALDGIVYGDNLSTNGLQFALIDYTNKGITVFLGSGTQGYTVLQGDSLRVLGRVSQFNGLTQFTPDSIILRAANQPLVSPTVVTKPTEDTESSLIRVNNLNMVDPSEWKGDGSSFNIRAVSPANPLDTTLIRVDSDTEVASRPAPTQPFDIIGIGGQFDNTQPYTSGYQLFPRFNSDILEMVGTQQADWSREIILSPNPATDWVNLQTSMTLDQLTVTDTQGKLVMRVAQPHRFGQMPIGDLAPGVYIFRFEAGGKYWATQLVKQ